MTLGKVWWTELNTWDADAAMAFYGQLMGWTFESPPINKEGAPPYYVAKRDGEVMCGIFTLRSPDFDGMPSHWFTYLAVDDFEESMSELVALGGTVRREKICIAGVGTFAIVADPTGAVFGMIEPETD
jgi:predicted enzyme related to lactoylglutathione lyase